MAVFCVVLPNLKLTWKGWRSRNSVWPNSKLNSWTHSVSDGHIIQHIVGCEWDDETNELDGYVDYGNDGEDFIAFDFKKATWIISDAQAETVKEDWDRNDVRNGRWKHFITIVCPARLKMFMIYGKSYVNRRGKD